MSVYSVYYSPTGGTKKVSDIIAGGLSEDFGCIDLFKKDTDRFTFGKDDICVISVPVFGGRVPADALEKLSLFRADGAFAILTAVFGNRAVDDALVELYDASNAIGFTVVACVEAVAEHSLVRLFGAGRPNENDKTELEGFAKEISLKLTRGNGGAFTVDGNRPYKDFKPSAMKPEIDASCDGCKRCAIECPVGAIPFDNVKKVDAEKCFSCMHCVAVCPRDARHNSADLTASLEERLRARCSDKKANKLYL